MESTRYKDNCVLAGMLLRACLITSMAPLLVESQVYGRELRITTVLLEPYMMARYTRDHNNITTSVRYEGYLADLIEHLSNAVGFKYKISVAPDNNYGYKRSDGSWNGMIKELLVKKADIAAGSMLDTSQRREVVDFTVPFLNVHATVLMRKPSAGSEPLIRNVKELVNQSAIRYGTLDKGIIPRAFKKTNDSDLRLLWKNMNDFQNPVLTTTNEQGINRARSKSEDYVFVIQDTIGDYVSMLAPCDLMTVDKFLLRRSYALALRKGSVWVKFLNQGLQQLRQQDVLNSLYRKWWVERSDCDTLKPSRSISLAATSSGTQGWREGLFILWVALVITVCVTL